MQWLCSLRSGLRPSRKPQAPAGPPMGVSGHPNACAIAYKEKAAILR